MARVTRKEWYRRVNAAWPANVPPLTAPEAERAARRLYRFITKRTFDGKITITSGNRENKFWRGHFILNPQQGWHDLVHTMSHWFQSWAGTHGHNAAHARFEMRMIKEAVRRGWLEGTLKSEPKPEPAPVDARAQKIERTDAAIKRWETKLKRAETWLKKLRRRQKALGRAALTLVTSEAA